MRTTLVNTLMGLAQQDRDVFLLTADLGFKLFDPFREAFGSQFLNVGVAEQNMVGVAAGLGLEGKKVFCYSMVPFIVFRALEQVRVDICYHKLGVTLVGVGGGLTYGFEGVTHHAIEDLAITRALPNMTVVAPGDPAECAAAVRAAGGLGGPLYLRLGGNNDPLVHPEGQELRVGRGVVVRRGEGAAIIAIGSMLAPALATAEIMGRQGPAPSVVSMHTLKPLDQEMIQWCAERHETLVTMEEHSEIGGLGSAVAESLLGLAWQGRFVKIALPDQFCSVVGNAQCLRAESGLEPEAMARRILAAAG